MKLQVSVWQLSDHLSACHSCHSVRGVSCWNNLRLGSYHFLPGGGHAQKILVPPWPVQKNSGPTLVKEQSKVPILGKNSGPPPPLWPWKNSAPPWPTEKTGSPLWLTKEFWSPPNKHTAPLPIKNNYKFSSLRDKILSLSEVRGGQIFFLSPKRSSTLTRNN